jgi:hypothetical protein
MPEPTVAPLSIPSTDSSDQLVLPRAVSKLPMKWTQAAKPCAIAAAIAAAGMVLKLVVPLIAAIGAGFLAVALYRRQNLAADMSARVGVRVGALCGVFTTCLSAIFATIRVAILGEGGAIRKILLDAVEQQAGRYSDPQFQPTLDFMRSNAGLAFMLLFLGLFGLILFVILGLIGGAIGGVSFRSRDR